MPPWSRVSATAAPRSCTSRTSATASPSPAPTRSARSSERFGGRLDSALASLRRLREQGVKLAVDDVGTGNAGLEMLREVGADFVKLDRSIVAGAPEQSNARAVLLAMATFARQTGAYVIAEGIEDGALLDDVRTLDDALPRDASAMIQGGPGYGLGRPSPEVPAAGASLDALAPSA